MQGIWSSIHKNFCDSAILELIIHQFSNNILRLYGSKFLVNDCCKYQFSFLRYFEWSHMSHSLHTYLILKRRDIMSIVYDTRWDYIWLLKLLLLPFVFSWPRVFPFHKFTYANGTRLHFLYIYEVSSIQWFSRLLHNKTVTK